MASAARAVAAPSASNGNVSSARRCRVAARRGGSGVSLHVNRRADTTHVAFAGEGGAGGVEPEVVATSAEEVAAPVVAASVVAAPVVAAAVAEVPSKIDNMQAMLDALMAENQALQGKITELGPPAVGLYKVACSCPYSLIGLMVRWYLVYFSRETAWL